MSKLTLGSLFDGSGTFPVAGLLSGIEPVWGAEIQPFPIRVTEKRLPQMKHYGDVSKLNGGELSPVDIITFGSPCQDLSVAGKRDGLVSGRRSNLFFEAVRIIKEMRCATNEKYPRFCVWENVCFHEDTLITCESGYKKIKDISVGDRVKTHTGRYMPVAKVHQTKKQSVLKLKVSGSEDVILTYSHPIYAIKKIYSGKNIVGITTPEWIPAGKLTDKHLVGYKLDIPSLPENFMLESEAWAVGRWMADGSVDLKKCNPRMFFSIGIGKEEIAREHLNKLPYNIYENKPHPTATNFCFTSHEFYTLISDVGIGAANKKVPAYVFKLPFNLQKAVLDGYLSGDGYIRKRGNHIEISANTSSRELAYGISRLIRNVYKTAANISVNNKKNGCINGRVLHSNNPTYDIYASLTKKVTRSIVNENIIWQPVKAVEPVKEKYTVYNLSVLEDNTYAANDIIVHNCGALSSGGGEDFHIVLEQLCKIKSPDISVSRPDGKWSKAGEIMGDGFSLAYRVLDACHWGVPQRRKRIYLVADLDGQRAGKILFESEGVSGYSAKGFRTWQSTAGSTPSGIGTPSICLDDQGGSYINISDNIAGTLRAEIHGHAPAVLESAGFCTEHSAKARSIGYEKEKSPTLRAGTVPAAIALEHHPNDSRIKLSEDNCCQTLTSRCGTGGGNVPLLMETPKTLKIRCGGGCGGKGALIQDDLSATIACNNDQTVFVPTAYGICSKDSNAMKSDNPNSGFYKADTAKTIDTSNQSPCKNQGGMVVIEGNGSRPSHHGNGYSESETMYTLNCVETHGVAYGIDRAAFNQGKNALYNFAVTEEVEPTMVAKGPGAVAAPVYSSNKASHFTRADENIAGTLVATDYKDPPLVNDVNYVVRRLTPKECALLQGMPAWWCDDLGSDDPSEEEIEKWTAIFEEYRLAVKPDSKPKSRNAVIKWLKSPHSDSAEYTMWGNGIALPNAYFVLSGIAYFADKN